MKILIIKLGAKGDILRTLPLLIGLSKKYPDSEISWLTRKEYADLLSRSPYLKNVFSSFSELNEDFDIVYNLEIGPVGTSMTKDINAKKLVSFYDENDNLIMENTPIEFFLEPKYKDQIKKLYDKTYQEMIFYLADLEYKKEHHELFLDKSSKDYAEEFIKRNLIDPERLIGIHIGVSLRWQSKVWHESNIIDFIILARSKGYDVLLFAGPDELEKQKSIKKNLEDLGISIYVNDPKNSDNEFMSLINKCSIMVCPDSFSLQVALTLKKPSIGLFFCTPPYEIESYGIFHVITSPLLNDFFPDRMMEYSDELAKSISPEKVMMVLEEIISKKTKA